MTEADLTAPRRTRLGIFVLVALLHVAAILALIRAFAPDFTAQAVDRVFQVFTVTVTTPPPSPSPSAAVKAGAAAPEGKKAVPRAAAPVPKIAIAKRPAPKASGSGSADRSGARDSGAGTGAGGAGNGTGSGAGGTGQGAGGSKLEKTAGEINSVRDFPRETRDKREGTAVVVEMTVGTDGRARDCRVVTPGGDPEADRIVCRLAEQRFRFRPRTDAAGNPVTARYRWRQRWWNPRD